MREIVLKEAMDEAFQKLLEERAVFFTPEHLLLPFLRDVQMRVLLAGASVDPDGLTELITDYLHMLPKWKGKMQRPLTSAAIPRILHRLSSRSGQNGVSRKIHGIHFLEAYIYDGAARPCLELIPYIPSLLAAHHSEIEFAAYGKLPEA